MRPPLWFVAFLLTGCRKPAPAGVGASDAAIAPFPTRCYAFIDSRNPYDSRGPLEPRWPERARPRLWADVTTGTPAVVGVASDENVRRVLHGFRGALGACYMDRIATESIEYGQPRVALTIDSLGEVIDAEFVERAGAPDDVAWCMIRRCCGAYFYAPETFQVTIEIRFTVVPTAD